MLCDILILNFYSFFNIHAFKNLGGVRAACDGRSASKSFEHGFIDLASLFIYLDLEFHDVTASWCANKSCSDVWIFFVKGSDVARIFIVVDHILVISKAKT